MKLLNIRQFAPPSIFPSVTMMWLLTIYVTLPRGMTWHARSLGYLLFLFENKIFWFFLWAYNLVEILYLCTKWPM